MNNGTYNHEIYFFLYFYLGRDVTKVILLYLNTDMYFFCDKIFYGCGKRRKAFSSFFPTDDGRGIYVNITYNKIDKCYSLEIIYKKQETQIQETAMTYKKLKIDRE